MSKRIGLVLALVVLAAIVGFIVRPSSAATIEGARLGGNPSAFIALWGKPASRANGGMQWGKCPESSTYQRAIGIAANRVLEVQWNHCDVRPFAAGAVRAAVLPVLPPDVRYSPASPKGTTYHSAALKAADIPAGLYLGCNFVPEPPGTLWVGTGSKRDWFSVTIGVGCPND